MRKMTSWGVLFLSALPVVTVLHGADTQNKGSLPDAPGKAVVQKMCVGCHSANVLTSKRATPAQWSAIVQQMISRGAEGTDEQVETVMRYLNENFGPNNPLPPAAAQTGQPQSSGPGSQVATEPVESQTIETPVPEPDRRGPTVNVNSAGAKQLQRLLGLTAAEAQTLVRYREQNGNFKDWQEVGEVPGVPAGKIQDLRGRLAF